MLLESVNIPLSFKIMESLSLVKICFVCRLTVVLDILVSRLIKGVQSYFQNSVFCFI